MANGTGQQVDDWVSAYPAQTGAPPPPAPTPQPAPAPAPPPQTPQAGPDDWQGVDDWQTSGTDNDSRFSTASLGPYFQPDFETTVYGKAPPPEPDDFAHNWIINPFKQTAASLAEAHANAAHLGSNIAGFLDDASNWVHQKTGLPYGHSMQYVKNMFDEMHNEAQGVASDFSGGRQDMPSRIVRGVGNVAFNLPAYVLATQTLGPFAGMAAMGGLENLDKGPGATLQGAAEGAALGAAMWVMGPMGRLVRLNGNALLNYFYSKWKGADDDTALMNAGIGGVVGMLPGRQPYPEWLTRARPGVTPNLTPQAAASEEYMAEQGIQTPAGMRLGSDWMQKFGGTLQGLPGGGRYGRGIQEAQQKLIGPVQETELGGIYPEKVTPEEAATGVQEQLEKNLEDTKKQIAQQVHPTPTTPEEAGTAIQTKLSSDLANERSAIAQQVSPTPTTPEAAGQGVIDRGKQSIQALSKEANQNYNQARIVEHDPRNLELVPVRDKSGDLVYNEDGSQKREKMALPIDMQDIQDTLAPVAARYEYTLTPTQRRDSPGLTAMQQIINGPRYKPLSAAELDLSMLKGAARTEKGLAELRDQSQGLAALSVSKLQDQIDNTMAGAHVPGWDPASGTPHPGLANLQAGRAATAEKYRIAEVLSDFGRQDLEKLEPVGVYNRMTWGRDSGINHLREVAQIAPNEMPAVGRAFIESGGDINQLGPQTKQILFQDPNVIRAIEQHHIRRQMFEPLTKMEPVQLVNRLTQAGGVRNNLLRAVAAQAPEQIPQLARAFIDSDANWNRLDPESKGILFHDTPTIQALDRYHANKQLFGPLIKMEPVLLSQRLAALGGTRNKLLEAVAKQTPEQMPRIARAWIQGLLERATREGTPQKVQSTIDEWLDMDPKSKALLLGNDAQQIRNLNNFFMSYKRLALNVNPSGSGFIQALNHWKGLVTGGVGAAIGMHTGHGVGMGMLTAAGFEALSNAAMSRLLFNERFIRMINKGMREQEAGNSQGARLAAASALQAASEHQEPPEEPPEEPPPTGGGSPSGPAGGGGKPPSLRDIAQRGFAREGDEVEAPIGGTEWDDRLFDLARRGITNLTPREHFDLQNIAAEKDNLRDAFGAKEGWRDKLNQAADNARKRINQFWKDSAGGGMHNMRIPLDVLADYSIVGAHKIVQGFDTFTDWAKEMTDEYGPKIQPHLRAIWKEAQHIGGMIGWGKTGKEEMPLSNRLTMPAGPVHDDAPPVSQKPKIHLVQKALDNLDVWHQRNPNMFANTADYIRGMNELFQPKNGRVPIPPRNLIAYSNEGPALGDSIDAVTPGQRALADQGLRESLKTRQLYADGKMTPGHSALYFAWGALSPRQSPYPQEAGFLHALDSGLEKWIDKSAKGQFTEKDMPAYLSWAGKVLKGTPGAQATSNLNSFGEQFLKNAAKPVENGPYKGMRTIDALHQIIGDQDLSSIEARRRYQQINNGLGLDNKVFSFVLLVTGRHDPLVADRVRINDFWDAPKLAQQGLAYTTNEAGQMEPTRNLYDNGMDAPWSGITGLGMYEAAEKALGPRIKQAYADRGINDGTIGRWHWETWLQKSGQEVSHGSLGAIAKMASEGKAGQQAVVGESVRQGKYNDLSYGVRYERTPQGFRYNWEKSDGSTIALTPEQHARILETLREMRDKKTVSGYTEKDRVIGYGTKTSEATEAPWRELPGVRKAALDRLIERIASSKRLVEK